MKIIFHFLCLSIPSYVALILCFYMLVTSCKPFSTFFFFFYLYKNLYISTYCLFSSMVRTVHSVVTFRAKLEHSPVGQRHVNIAIYLARLTLLSSNRVSLGCCNTRIRTDVTLGQRAVSQLDITGYSTNSRCFYISSLKG